MKKKVLIEILITILILSLAIMTILFFNMKNLVYIKGAEVEQKEMLIKHLTEENDELKREIDELNQKLETE